MISLDFISGEDFRISLENDYRELNEAIKVGAWKAVHVLAGSIIEALLIDYLVATGYQNEDPLRMTLEKAITICRQKGILSEKAEHISHAIRSYRNLIHPGRSIRLKEVADESGAKVAQGLVEIVVSEVAANKQKSYGFTAEQVIKKIVNDSSAVAILGHLLLNITEHEKERLLLNLIPQTYIEYWEPDEPGGSTLTSLSACFRTVYESASEETKKKVAQHTIKIIKEESQGTARVHLSTFFQGTDLKYLLSDEVQLLKQYLFSIMGKRIDTSLLNALEGIGPFLSPEDIWPLMTPIMKRLFKKSDMISTEDVKNFLYNEYAIMKGEAKDVLSDFLQEDGWTSLSDFSKEILTELRNSILDPFLPDYPDYPDYPDDIP